MLFDKAAVIFMIYLYIKCQVTMVNGYRYRHIVHSLMSVRVSSESCNESGHSKDE